MSCEKIAKAYRIRDTKADLNETLMRHTAFTQFVDSLLGSSEVKKRYKNRSSQLRAIRRIARPLAREIERLAPAVDRDRTPANAEYPWADGTKVLVPSEYHFSTLDELRSFDGIEFLRLLQIAIEEFDSITIA